MNSKWAASGGVVIIIILVMLFPIWMVDASQRQLVRQPADHPYLDRILFVSERGGGSSIYTMNSDGSDLEHISGHDFPEGSPSGHPMALTSPTSA